MITFALPLLIATSQSQPEAIVIPGTGEHSRKITTSSPKAQMFFNQGLNLMYAFNKSEALNSFKTAAAADPDCAMAWWGVAYANGPDYNGMYVDAPHEKAAIEAIKKAQAVMSDEPLVDQQIIKAATLRYKYPNPDRKKQEAAYSKSLASVWSQYPYDADLGALYGESMMNLRPWDLWKKDGTPQPGTPNILQVLQDVIRLNPKHPMANHLYIHAVEASATPQMGVRAADALRDLQPGLGHNLHMPSHIYVRVGAWQKAIDANAKALKADEAYRFLRPDNMDYWGLMIHNWHMLAFAAMMTGQKSLAISNIDAMFNNMPAAMVEKFGGEMDGLYNMPIDVRIRFGLWDEVLAYPSIDSKFPISVTLQHMARAMAHAAQKNVPQARMEQALFMEALKKSPFYGKDFPGNTLKVAEHLMNGEICVAEGKTEEAIAHLKKGIEAEDALDYSEPPLWIQPVRHTLGALLVKLGRYSEALEVYNADLKILPNNGWSLYGKSLCLENLGRTQDAAKVRALFDSVWASNETPITSSCICIPGKH
ncbi:MAG: tetratricopeptide repeat protein [Fimbriimonadaceae bacterium]